jgi:hypothetical protein
VDLADEPAVEEGEGGCFGCLLTIFLVGVGLLFTGLLVVWPLAEASRASGWAETTCEVVAHDLDEERDSDGDVMYTERVVVAHELDGVRHEGHRVGFEGTGSTNVRATFTGNLERFPAGSTHPCWYDPSDPDDVVLDRSVGQVLSWWMLMPLGLDCCGLFALVSTVSTFLQLFRLLRRR